MNTYTVDQKVTFTRCGEMYRNSNGAHLCDVYKASGVIKRVIPASTRTETTPEIYVVNKTKQFNSHEFTFPTNCVGMIMPLEVGTKVSWVEVTKGHFDPMALEYYPETKSTYTGVITSIIPKTIVTHNIPASYVIKADFDGKYETLKIGEIFG
jgi:hypothetical protein